MIENQIKKYIYKPLLLQKLEEMGSGEHYTVGSPVLSGAGKFTAHDSRFWQ